MGLLTSPSIYSAYADVFQFQFGGSGSGDGQFSSPIGDAVDGSGNIWVVDQNNNRVEKFTSSGSYTSQFGTSGSGNGGFDFPRGIAIDASGNIWIGDTGNNLVQEFDFQGNFKQQFGSTHMSSPNGIAITGSNELVASPGNNQIQKYDSLGNYITAYTGGNGNFASPQNVAVDSSGNIWISDTGNNRVVELSSTGTYISQIGCASSTCTASGNNGSFSGPMGLAFDTNGNLWVVDKNNNRVEEFNSSGTYLGQIGCGTGSCTGGSGNGQFSNPAAVAINTNNVIYVVDEGNNLVQAFQ